MTVLAATLLASHLLALPTPPAADPRLTAGIASLAASRPTHLVHFVAVGCNCSAKIVERLVTRGALPDATETIVAVGTLEPPTRARAEAAGFRVVELGADDVEARFGAVAAPLLAISIDGATRYVGGYTARKQAPFIADLSILERVRRGEDVDPLPLFGCPVNQQLAKRADPLGLR